MEIAKSGSTVVLTGDSTAASTSFNNSGGALTVCIISNDVAAYEVNWDGIPIAHQVTSNGTWVQVQIFADVVKTGIYNLGVNFSGAARHVVIISSYSGNPTFEAVDSATGIGSDDSEVVVAFDGVGIKKLLLSFAKLEKVE